MLGRSRPRAEQLGSPVKLPMAAVWGAGSALGSGVVARGVKVLDPSTDSVSEAGVLVGRQDELLRLETGEGAKSIKEDFRVVARVLLDGQAAGVAIRSGRRTRRRR